METFYGVTCSGIPCGKVSVRQQGLYYHVHCRCKVVREDIYRLILTSGDHQENLGILIPEGDSFVLSRKIPAKQFPEGEWLFRIVSKEISASGCFVPISPDEPFAYISRLKDSFLVYHNGQPGIEIGKMQE